eukprot:CAMPEP_0169124794 /NCGR_PEP_ID=MMETSP1015-20121227/34521_1 /TAXON_ID=342587 /ORGANISM="Karlodinium micrum, Strain CCMP2283" /LENGTH=339 /DNA_ID=CAMNT_0009188247 /DNA_START=198 /DNA_END=1217 /DNA_ORIENTATION=+
MQVYRDSNVQEVEFRRHAATVQNLTSLETSKTFWIVLAAVIVVGCLGPLGPCGLYILARIIGEAVEHTIEYYSLDFFGCQVDLDWIDVGIFHGYIHISNLKVENPRADTKYSSEYLLQADEIYVDVDMLKLIRSWMTVYEIEKITFVNMHINYERPYLGSNKSNLQDVLDHLKNTPEESAPRAVEPVKAKPKRFLGVPLLGGIGNARTVQHESSTKMYVREVRIEQVSAKMALRGNPVLSIRVPPINYEDFSKSHRNADTAHKVMRAMAKEILGALFKSLLPRIPDTSSGISGVSHALEQASQTAHGAIVNPITSCCTGERETEHSSASEKEFKPLTRK